MGFLEGYMESQIFNQVITIVQLLTPSHAAQPGSGVLREALLTLPPKAGLVPTGKLSAFCCQDQSPMVLSH